MNNYFNKYIAEFFGTFGLSLAVVLSLALNKPLATPFAAALTLGLFVYTIGPISGAHLNPAVTIGLLSIKKISSREAVKYIVAQFLGALAVFSIARFAAHLPSAPQEVDGVAIGAAEILGAFFFTFGIAAVVYEKVPASLSGLVIGGSLLLGIFMAASVSAAILNPAVALGINSLSLVYAFAPIFGGILGFWAFTLISGEEVYSKKTE